MIHLSFVGRWRVKGLVQQYVYSLILLNASISSLPKVSIKCNYLMDIPPDLGTASKLSTILFVLKLPNREVFNHGVEDCML